MKITSTGIVNGIIEDRFGKRGTQFAPSGMATYSLPVRISEAPEGTVSYALFLEDKDAVPVCGFSWIHWLVAGLTRTKLEENESIRAKDFVQGTNSLSGKLGNLSRMEAACYDGMSPPDRPHLYELHAYALDFMPQLKTGFYMNELFHAMHGHILGEAVVSGMYFDKITPKI
ncbi:MAG: YbhB/YbcL family Raf kinase inhibitor-like protein [Eubacteriales bacterium]